MWLWQEADPAEVITWCRRHGVSDLFAYWVKGTPDLAWYADLRVRTTAAGMTLSALGGDASWLADPVTAAGWLNSAHTTGLFDGFHLDIQPWTLPAWTTNHAGTLADYVSLLTMLAAVPEPVELDVPYWLGILPYAGGSLADEVLSLIPRLCVLAYRNTAIGLNSIFTLSLDLLARGSTANAAVRLGVETQPVPALPFTSFYGLGSDAMDKALTVLGAAAQDYTSFHGDAVNHYHSWRALGV